MSERIAAQGRPLRGAWPLPRFALIPRFDEDARLVMFAQTLAGRAVLILLMMLLASSITDGPYIVAGAACAAYLPRFRRHIISGLTLGSLLLWPNWSGYFPTLVGMDLLSFRVATALVVVFAMALVRAASRIGPRGPFGWPVASLLGLVTILALLGTTRVFSNDIRTALWNVTFVLTAYMWFIAYAVTNATSRRPVSMADHLAALHPFWGSTATPFGKGAAYFQKFESRSAEALAVTQLKALKLLIWAEMLSLALNGIVWAFYAQAGVPLLSDAIAGEASGHPFPRSICWLSLVANFLFLTMNITVMGHIFVACCRFAGFRIPRNTCRPFISVTIAEFWNRFYFYFKELLVDFFFFPTFKRFFKASPKIRVAFSTFMAAGFGNFVFHFFRDIHIVRDRGLGAGIVGMQSYAFYCLVLASGICVSQLRTRPPEPAAGGWMVAGRRICGVIIFFLFVSVFDDGGRLPLLHHFGFLLHMFVRFSA